YESIQPVEKKEYYALSSAQQRLCILQHMYLDSTGYNLPHHFYLPEETDIGKLDDTFHKLINRHESLRTSFHMIADKPVQRIHENVEFKIEHLDLAALDDAGLTSVIQDGGLISLIHYSFIRPFDLSRAPLLRAGWTKLENQQYLLMVDMHHIISDGISHDILLKDFMALYKGDGLPPLRIQYKEFSQWQHHEKENEGIKQQKNYWLKVFAGEIPVLQIPSDYPRPEIQDFAGISVDAAINPEKSGLLKQYAVREGVTLYMLFLAVTNILFSKLSGQEDIVAGTPVAGRRHADLELIIGMFVNTLPMRNYPVGDKTFKQFLAEVKTRTLEAFDNQEYPFEDMVDQVGVNRDAGRNPLFDVMFALQNNDNRQVPVLDEDTFRIGHTRSKFDITITAFESRENISFNFIYNTALFKIETIKRFIGCFKKIILAITPECDTKLFHIEIISTEEKRQLLNEFNDTGTAYPQEKTIHQLFGEQVSKTPDNIAVVGSTLGVETLGAASLKIQMSYHQLDEQSNCLAGLLIEKGLLPDNIVAIMVERSIEMIIGIMGIFKSGGAYLPIDPGYPQERIDYMLKDSNAAVLLIANEEKIIDNRQLSIVNTQFSTGESPCNFHHSAFITPHSNPFHLCYIIYTSGTTGKPKGAMIEQRGMVNHIYAKIHDLQLDNRSVVAQNASQMFDISVWQLFAALIVGGRTVIIPNEIIREPMNFMAHILDSKINILEVVPSYLAALLDIPSRANSYSSLPLKYLLVTGEAINPDLLKKWFSKYPGIKVVNAYGPTEASDDITHYIMHKAPEMNRVPIGSPVQNMYIYIVDKYMTLCPLGVPGELYVAGTGIGRGYLNRPELTADRFKRNVISRWSFVNGKFQTDNNPLNLTNDYFYRTGDLAYWLNDGNIVFLGRIDHQVKIRGFRIELGEIENQLITYPGIKEAVVTANEYESGNGDKYLAAYFVSAVKLEIPVLREYLLKNLPDYMVPAYFIALEKIPLTPNGKIDRKALPPPEITTGIGFTAPGNELEAKLVEIWAEVLGMEENIIGINDNFFHLGGHSLKAIIMTQRVHKELYVKLPLTEVFKTPTIRGLTGFIKKSSGDNFVSLDPVELKEYYPLSSTQKRMYVAQQMDLHSKSYNMPTALELEGELNKEKLTGVFKKLLQRHDSLRTSFLMLEEGPVQRILNAADITFNLENYETMGNKSLEREIITHFLRPFVLSKAPLLRAGLIKKDKEKYMLIVDQHHIISDGISMSILITDFTDFYQDKELLPLRIQYKDFSEWQNRLLESGNMKKQEDYWLDIFKVVVPVLNIPTDYPRPAVRNINKGETIEFRLEEGLCRQLNHLVKETNTTIFIVLLAVYNVLLFKYTGQEDIIVGSPITGRSHVDLQNVIGVFLNMLAIRNRPQQRKVFRDFLKEVKENALDAFENQDYPFDELVKK
ncbi:MAG: amino acid adenylation domain-containing protein, partial [Acidobacteria bacterium]|nr:amino acid adenylation domain-containing protein [Acidobacteriota bacterium]